jgi:hypothetical protein
VGNTFLIERGWFHSWLTELASTITDDTKALNPGTPLATLVLRALAARQGAARPRTVGERRDLWDQCGIIVDDLASRVLKGQPQPTPWDPALADAMSAAARAVYEESVAADRIRDLG